MRLERLGKAVVMVALSALTSCSALPRSGPDMKMLESNAVAKVGQTGPQSRIKYVLVDLTRQNITLLSKPVQSTSSAYPLRGLGGSPSQAPAITLGPGDVISVTIFESQSGGLFVPADAGSRPGNYVTLPNQTVARDGTITVPYAGRIRVTGLPIERVQQLIQNKLESRAIEPQVQITQVANKAAQVSVLGDINSPRKVDISAGEKVLDAIADAGGLASPQQEAYVTLLRAGRQAGVSYQALVQDPALNIYLVAGDTLSIVRQRRTFLAFGALTSTGAIDFSDEDLSLADAIGKAGGLIDSRAEPGEVYVFRRMPRQTVAATGAEISGLDGEQIPVILRANLRDPSAIFAISQLKLQDKDVVYVSNSSSYELTKFLDVLNVVSASGAAVPIDAVGTRDAWRNLAHGG